MDDDITEVLLRYVVDFETDHVIFISAPDADDDRPSVRLSLPDFEEFRKLEGEYWAWQTTLKAQYRAAVRAQMEGTTDDG